jgi:hypothetical protein
MLHEIVTLLVALRWPAFAFFVVLRFDDQIRTLLSQLPTLLQRVKSARAFGVNVTLNEINKELPTAERETLQMQLPAPKVPKRPKKTEG